MSANDKLKIIAAINTVNANALTLCLVQIFGEKKTHTDEKGKATVAKWLGKYYMLDFEGAK